MKTFEKMAAQGDIVIIKIDELPKGLTEVKSKKYHVVAHSETGHHHVLEAKKTKFFQGSDPMLCYAVVMTDIAELVHQRPFNTHETIGIKKGTYEIRRQREYTPEGWRRVAD